VGAYQNLFRLGGLVLAALIAFTLVGMIRSQGQIRFALFLFGLNGLCFYIIPVLTISYDFRYGIPAEILVVVSGLLGIISFWPIPSFRLTNK
jgi:lipopolysaccharide export LptBFGC system permease protein LptF